MFTSTTTTPAAGNFLCLYKHPKRRRQRHIRELRAEGEYLALYNGALLGNSPDLDALLSAMAEKTAEEGKEFINIFYGADTTPEQASHAAELFTKALPNAEVNVLSGGQPIYYYLISAE